MAFNIQSIMGTIYRDKISRIASAYQAAKMPFELEIRQVHSESDAFERKVLAGSAFWQETSDDGEIEYDHGEAFGERLDEAEDALDGLRKAFAIFAYHTWERGAQRWFDYSMKKPNHVDFIIALVSNNVAYDHDGLRDLNNLVNCLKHNSATSGPNLWKDRSDLFKPGFNPSDILPLIGKPPSSVDWEDQIKLSDANISIFFDTVRISSPK